MSTAATPNLSYPIGKFNYEGPYTDEQRQSVFRLPFTELKWTSAFVSTGMESVTEPLTLEIFRLRRLLRSSHQTRWDEIRNRDRKVSGTSGDRGVQRVWRWHRAGRFGRGALPA